MNCRVSDWSHRGGLGSLRDRERPEASDEILAWKLEKRHVVSFGVLKSTLIVPVMVIDVIGGDDGAGTIGPAQTVHEDGTAGGVL